MVTLSESQEPLVETTKTVLTPNATYGKRSASTEPLTLGLFVVISVIVLFLMVLLSTNLYFQHQNYMQGIQAAIAGKKADHTSIVAYSRSWDFAVIKTSAMFLAFTLIFTGALYVLGIREQSYRLSAEGIGIKGALETSSPGLAMVTLGVVLVIFVIYAKSVVDYRPVPAETAVQPQGVSKTLSTTADQVDNKSTDRKDK